MVILLVVVVLLTNKKPIIEGTALGPVFCSIATCVSFNNSTNYMGQANFREVSAAISAIVCSIFRVSGDLCSGFSVLQENRYHGE